MKVFVVGGDTSYARWINDCELVSNLKDADIVFFTGGEDVTPKFYNCKQHRRTYCSIARDNYEQEIFNNIRTDQLALGVCRGLKLWLTLNTVNCWNAVMPISSQA